MTYSRFVVNHYSKLENRNVWETTPTQIDAFDIVVKTAIGDKKNIFEFKVVNNNDKYSTFFSSNDKVVIYGVVNSDTYDTDDDLLMSGLISKVDYNLDGDKEIFTIKGEDYSAAVMRAIIFADAEGKTPIEFIDECRKSINARNNAPSPSHDKHIGWDVNNPTLKSDGSPFPVMGKETQFDKSFKTVMEKYLAADVLQDGKYFWYISVSNDLVIRKRTNEITQVEGSDLSINEGEFAYSIKIQTNTDEVFNWVIWKAGRDTKGRSIQNYKQDTPSIVKNGMRPKIIIRRFAQDLFEAEKQNNLDSFSEGNQYPDDAAYPYTTVWTDPNTLLPVTVANKDEYNDALYEKVKYMGEQDAQNFLDLYKYGYKQVSIQGPINLTYQVGQLLTLNAPRLGLNEKLLRVHEVNHGSKGTDILIQEDEATIGQE